jgi:catechol 2,3-dioxygenase-like lactoylglutathione lyase family enzyme
MDQLLNRLAGVELYFENLPAARKFYTDILSLRITSEEEGHHAQFDTGSAFLCLEAKGVEDYPSRDKAVLFFEVPDLPTAIATVGERRVLRQRPREAGRAAWAVLHDPEGHNIILLERSPLTR